MELHGLKNTPEYVAWQRMKSRCYYVNNEHFSRYGGRGITVCLEWRESFTRFLYDMGKKPTPKHQLDRIDNNGNYEPNNCRWVTPKQNMANRHNTTLITIHGVTKPLQQWSDESGVSRQTLHWRARHGKPMEDLVSV
jgi:hypothetical protein